MQVKKIEIFQFVELLGLVVGERATRMNGAESIKTRGAI